MNCKEHALEGEAVSKEFFKIAILKNALDEKSETTDNLASLLLTNTTLRSDADKTAEQGKGSLKINSR